jgi:hypothetical protein
MFGLKVVRTNSQPPPALAPDGTRLTPARQLALMQAEHAASGMMQTIRWAKRLAWLLVLIVMSVSYEDQHNYLIRIGMRPFGALLIPFAFDTATVLCVMVVGTQAMKRSAKVIALSVVAFPVCASAFINAEASPSAAVAIVYVLVVLLIPAIELIKAFMGADFRHMMAAEEDYLDAAKQSSRASSASRARITPQEREARKRAGYQKMSQSQKRRWTQRYRAGVARRVPVSPAPAGPLRDLTMQESAQLAKV